MDAKLKFLITLVAGIILVGAGIQLSYSTLNQQLQGDEKVEATVLESELQIRENTDTYGTETYDYRLYVNYSYTYNGESYTNDQVSPGLSVKKFDDKKPAKDELSKYSPGDKVTAYVDPDNPRKSYLVKADTIVTLIGSGVLLLLGIPILFMSLIMGGSYLIRLSQPGPDEVNPSRNELRNKFRKILGDIDNYPIEDYRDIQTSSIDKSRKIKSNDFEITVRDLDYIMKSEPDSPLENPEELTDYLINEMDKQGYFY